MALSCNTIHSLGRRLLSNSPCLLAASPGLSKHKHEQTPRLGWIPTNDIRNSCVSHLANKCSYMHSEQYMITRCTKTHQSCNITKSDFSTLVRHHGHVSRTSLAKLTGSSQRHLSISPKAIFDASPLSVQPYLRLIRFDKPIGSWLLFWPCSWSIALAAAPGQLPDLKLLSLFGAGSFFMRGAGCIINDLYDRDFDKMVYRTKDRPLASGQLNVLQALSLLGFQLSVSLGILLQLNWYSVILGASSMGLVIVYPLAKRFTYWPQVVLGLTFNWGALLGWSAVQGSCTWGAVLPLYLSGVAWTMVYDTIYAHQDKEDDILVGVKSTALRFGDGTKRWLTGFSTLMVGNLALAGYLCDQTLPYYLSVAVISGHLAHQIYSVDLDNPDDCFSKFKANSRLGLLLFLGIVAGTWAKSSRSDTDTETKDA